MDISHEKKDHLKKWKATLFSLSISSIHHQNESFSQIKTADLFRVSSEVSSDNSLHGQISSEVSTEVSPADMTGSQITLILATITDEMTTGALKYLPGRPHYLKTNGTLKLLVQGGCGGSPL